MASEQLISGGATGSHYVQMQSEPSRLSSLFSFHQNPPETTRIFDELPKATIVQLSRPDAGDISPMLLSYTIDFQYKQV
ncbi:putative phospholipase D [Helianthus anomalus]